MRRCYVCDRQYEPPVTPTDGGWAWTAPAILIPICPFCQWVRRPR